MPFRIKDKVKTAVEVARTPIDVVWLMVGAGVVLVATFAITGYIFLKDRKNPFYHIQNPDPPTGGIDDTTTKAPPDLDRFVDNPQG